MHAVLSTWEIIFVLIEEALDIFSFYFHLFPVSCHLKGT